MGDELCTRRGQVGGNRGTAGARVPHADPWAPLTVRGDPDPEAGLIAEEMSFQLPSLRRAELGLTSPRSHGSGDCLQGGVCLLQPDPPHRGAVVLFEGR